MHNERNYNRRYPYEYNWFSTLFHLCFVTIVVRAYITLFYECKITGRENSPDLYACMQILGKDTVLERLRG